MKSKLILKYFIFTLILSVIVPARAYAGEPDAGGLNALSACMIDVTTGFTIFNKDMRAPRYPASITKLMTVLLALEYAGGDYTERVVFSRDAVYSLPYDSSNIAMDADESLTFEQALYAIMLASANEVANAVAEHIAGSAEEFAKRMTERAAELGCRGTHFMNPHGLHDDMHYTTAYDMALIMRECVKHPFFLTLISTVNYDIPPTEKREEIREMINTNRLIREGEYFNPDVVGGKTGFTDPAGHTLVTYAKRGDIELIVCVMKNERGMIYTDTTALLEYGFNIFETMVVLNRNSFFFRGTLPVVQNYRDEQVSLGLIKIAPAEDLSFYLPKNITYNDVKQIPDLPGAVEAPVASGQTVGTVAVYLNDYKLGETDIVSLSDVLPADPADDEEPENEEEARSLYENALVLLSSVKTMMYIFAATVPPLLIVRRVLAGRRRRRRIFRYYGK